jgi:hypothetical protein
VPSAAVAIQDEGVSTGSSRGTLNFRGIDLKATDDAGNSRVNVHYRRHSLWVAGIF